MNVGLIGTGYWGKNLLRNLLIQAEVKNIFVLDYNMRPIKKNKGSAIFIHVAKKNYSKTQGCIAVKKTDLLNIAKKIKINTRVKIENRK